MVSIYAMAYICGIKVINHKQNQIKMNINQKVYAIVKKDTKEIVLFSLTPNAAYAEWNDYFVGTEEEQTHELQQTFMSQDEIKAQMSL